jgi:hypothetical protein
MAASIHRRFFFISGSLLSYLLNSIILLQPAGEYLAILLVGIDETGMAGVPEQMPLTAGDMLIKRSRHNGGADVVSATTDKGRLRDLV